MLMRILSLFLAMNLCLSIEARDWAPMSNVELVEAAKLVVYGKLFKENQAYYVDIEAVLKGETIDTVEIGVGFWLSPVLIKGQETGVFFLYKRADEDIYRYFHPSCFKEKRHLQKVERAIDIWKNPAKYVFTSEEEGADVNYVLGRLFSGWRIHSEEATSFAERLSWYFLRTPEEALWEEKESVTLTVDINENNDCLVESNRPNTRLSKVFEKKVKGFSQSSLYKNNLPAEFTISADNTRQNLPGISYEQATTYLRNKLASNDPTIVTSAIQALSIIGDTACIPLLIPLIRSSDEGVSLKAIESLGWSRSSLAVDSIGSFMVENCVFDEKQKHYKIPNTAAAALRRINEPSGVPYLEAIAKSGYSWVLGALGAIGREESVRVLIAAVESNPDECFSAVRALRSLVARSNYRLEEWMEGSNQDDGHKQKERIPLWIEWSKNLKDDFKIIKTQEELLEGK